MRRGRRSLERKDNKLKNLFYLFIFSVVIMIVSFIITSIVYNKNLKKYSSIASEQMNNKISDINLESKATSSEIGKNITEALNETIDNDLDTEETNNDEIEENNTIVEINSNEIEEEIIIEDPIFISPVNGEVIKEFAKDKLVYSETLDEWVTHNGIDIKAERTTVVKASAPGTVEAIKNDPRYGLTVIIEHVNGFKTIYSNLLTAEFIKEGEELIEGQSIGTVGNSSVFEISDEPHLHFEITKDGEYIDPMIYVD